VEDKLPISFPYFNWIIITWDYLWIGL